MTVDYRQLLKDVVRSTLLEHGTITSPCCAKNATTDRATFAAYMQLVREVLGEEDVQTGRFEIWANRGIGR
jgi:hypothetical protein